MTTRCNNRAYAFCGALLAGVLTACGGGGGSGGSQDPDPVLVDLPIAYVKRPLPVDVDNQNSIVEDEVLDPAAFNPGAALYVRDRASPSAAEINVTDRAWAPGELYDVKDVEASFDGEKLIFAMRAPDDPDLNDDEQAKWDIWEYELATDNLRRIITDDITAQLAHDVAPHYLPDGSIVFSSDRQQRTRSILLDDGKPQYAGVTEDYQNDEAFVLHVMDDDGTNLDQLTYNQSHDLQPTVLADGRILFVRWDHYARDILSLYTVYPDGSGLQFYYGYHSQDTGTNNTAAAFTQPREMPDGRILSVLRPRQSGRFGGDMVLIDGTNFTEIDQPTYANAGSTGPGQVSASVLEVITDETAPSPHGRFNAAYPFYDNTNRLLVSWNQCRLVNPDDPDPMNPSTFVPCTTENLADPNAVEADPLYGVWIYNPVEGTQLPVITPEENVLYTDVVTLEPRRAPAFIQPKVPGVDVDQSLLDEGVGVVHIRSVYDFAGVDTSADGITAMRDSNNAAYATRPARFLRIVKAVSEPDNDIRDFNAAARGRSGAQRMKEILGYVPVEPDGSAQFKVPANVAFTLSVLDVNGRRITPRHQNWLQVRAGEVLTCNGCHTANSAAPHGRLDAEPPPANPGAPTDGPFPNAQPNLGGLMGETMAQTYARNPTSQPNGPRTPAVDIVFTDEWGTMNTTPDINFLYSDLDSTLNSPALPGCENPWTAQCRVLIQYMDHIQPLWDLTREDAAMNDRTCINCHSKTDAMGADQVPPGQLELTGEAAAGSLNANNSDLFVRSYQELFVGDAFLELNGNMLRRRQTTVIDPDTGDPVEVEDPARTTPVMSANGANASNAFFSKFEAGGTHAGDLSPAELKLISEWLDIGAQYYNNPFDAPLN